MKIGIITGHTQKDKNKILEDCLTKLCKNTIDEIINFGIYEDAQDQLSYIEAALCVSLLLESEAIDFIITGCSSGQGMMLACNSFPSVLCGYVQHASDAYLFGRINHGNAISYPLGFQWGWAAEVNLKHTLQALLEEPMGIGYPKEEAMRKQHDSKQLKQIHSLSKKSLVELIPQLDQTIVHHALTYQPVYQYILQHSSHQDIIALIHQYHEEVSKP